MSMYLIKRKPKKRAVCFAQPVKPHTYINPIKQPQCAKNQPFRFIIVVRRGRYKWFVGFIVCVCVFQFISRECVCLGKRDMASEDSCLDRLRKRPIY